MKGSRMPYVGGNRGVCKIKIVNDKNELRWWKAGGCSMWVGSGVLGCLQNTAPVTLSRTQSRLNVNIVPARRQWSHCMQCLQWNHKKISLCFLVLDLVPNWKSHSTVIVLVLLCVHAWHHLLVVVCAFVSPKHDSAWHLQWDRVEDNWCVLLAPGTRRATKQITGSPNGQRSNFHYVLQIEPLAINIRIALDKFQSKHLR